jgi:trehalose synthase
MMSARLVDYAPLVGEAEVEEIRALARLVEGKRVKHVNSTAVGGGVAEILHRLVPLLEEVGIPTRWEVIKGGSEFFAVTKAFHNALHGKAETIRPEMLETFREFSAMNAGAMSFDEDVVVIHDPQPVALVESRKRGEGHWVWRCHIDVSNPDPQVWEFLRPWVEVYDAAIFSSPAFAQVLPIRQFLIPPSIDPLTWKNRDLEPEEIEAVYERFQIDRRRPVVLQVSRFDRLKDPFGLIHAYRMVKKRSDCQLVLAGGGATDDPEGLEVLQELRAMANGDPDLYLLHLPPASDLEINALVRGATVVVQNSSKEGFGLTVAEALWKGKPVVTRPVGGITQQVQHGLTGLLANSTEGLAYHIRYLLSHPDIGQHLGSQGREHVRHNFLITRHLRQALLLIIGLEHPGASNIKMN